MGVGAEVPEVVVEGRGVTVTVEDLVRSPGVEDRESMEGTEDDFAIPDEDADTARIVEADLLCRMGEPCLLGLALSVS